MDDNLFIRIFDLLKKIEYIEVIDPDTDGDTMTMCPLCKCQKGTGHARCELNNIMTELRKQGKINVSLWENP